MKKIYTAEIANPNFVTHLTTSNSKVRYGGKVTERQFKNGV